jgi:hypothetical protein
MKKIFFLLLLTIFSIGLFAQPTIDSPSFYVPGNKIYKGQQRILPTYWLWTPKLFVDTLISLRNDTLYGVAKTIYDSYTLGKEHYVASRSFVESYVSTYGGGGGSGVTPTDNILDWDETNSWYQPYTSLSSGLNFYTGTTNPTGTTRLNLNGRLHATSLFGGATGSNNGVDGYATTGNSFNAEIAGTGYMFHGTATSNTGRGLYIYTKDGSSIEAYRVGSTANNITTSQLYLSNSAVLNSYSLTGNYISIIDNPTGGTNTSKILLATIGSTKRISLCPRQISHIDSTAYFLDTHNDMILGKIFDIRNQGISLTYQTKDTLHVKGYLQVDNGSNITGTGGSGGGTYLVDNIFDSDTTNHLYYPYSTRPTRLGFYRHADLPSYDSLLSLNGSLRSYRFYAYGSGSSASIEGLNSGTGPAGVFSSVTGNAINASQISNSSVSAPLVYLTRSIGGTANATNNFLHILDNPSTSGTKSGKILSAVIGSTERISLYPRQTSGESNTSYFFDTHEDMVLGNIFEVRNQGVSELTVKKDTVKLENLKFPDNTVVKAGMTSYPNSTFIPKWDSVGENFVPNEVIDLGIVDVDTFDLEVRSITAESVNGTKDTIISFTNTQILAGDSVMMLPAPGAGKGYLIESVHLVYKYNTTVFTGTDATYIKNKDMNNTIANAYTILADEFDFIYNYTHELGGGTVSVPYIAANSPVWIDWGNNLASGGGSAKIKIKYQIITY